MRVLPLVASLSVLTLGGSIAACTIETVPPPPDAGEGLDAGPGDGGGSVDAFMFPPPTEDTCTEASRDATLGERCAAAAECDDGCFCNGVEACEGGVCVAGEDPCPDEIECTADVCLEETNRCFHDPQPELCSDGDACNGAEICDLFFGCTAAAPLYCNDESSCTVDSCDPASGCVFSPRDLDGDGFTDGRCGGDDCDDDPRFGRDIYPGAPEDCENRRDDDCDGSRDYNDEDCVPTNDTCDAPTLIAGPGTYSGATRGLRADYTLGCRTSMGADAVFRLTLTEAQNATITVAGGGAGAGVTLRRWADCATGPEIRCNAGSPPMVIARELPAGDYAILVQSSSPGAFDLNVRFEPPSPDPPGDTCTSAIDVTSAPGSAITADMLQDTLPSCTSSFGSYVDAFYYFDLAATQDVTVTTEDGTFHHASLSTTCGDLASELRCWSGGGTHMETWRSLAPGRYYIAIGSQTRSPSIDARVEIRPPTPIPPNDRCAGAIVLSDGTSRRDTTVGFADDERGGSCAGFGQPDAYYTFTLATRQRIIASVTDGDGGSTRYYLTLKDGCAGAEVQCTTASTFPAPSSGTIARNLDAGTYVLMVETDASDTSDYFIDFSVRPPI